ncbi:cytochrome P450 [soil metagenome]
MSVADTAALMAEVIVPTLAQGPIIRRPRMVAAAERFDLVGRAVRRVQRLHDTYGDGPIMLRVPIRKQAVVLAARHVHRVLEESPVPFGADSSEKRASLSHFQPKAVLISSPEERPDRRRFNEEVLETPRPMHRLSERFASVIEEEAQVMLARAERKGVLDWDVFSDAWFCMVRRVMLGDAAREDREFTRLHERLRAYANLAFLQPKRIGQRDEFFVRLNRYLDAAESDTLAAVMAATHATPDTAADHQIPHWLFAIDPAGMTTFRALALLAAHPEHEVRARDEAEARDSEPALPFVRQCLLESLRLWPTTPMILRQSSSETMWDGRVMPKDTGILVYSNYFHRDDRHLEYAHRFAPEVWSHERTDDDWPLVPFSRGPVGCPAQNLVLMITSTMLAALLRKGHYQERAPRKLYATHPMPSMLDNNTLRFDVSH